MVAPLRQAQFDYSGIQGILDRRAKMRSEMGKNKSIQEQLKSMAENKQRGRDEAGRNYVAGAIGQIQNEEEFGKLKEVVGNFGVSPHLMKNFDSYDEAEWEGKGDPDIPAFLKFRDSMSHWMTTGKEKKYEKPDTKKVTYWNEKGEWIKVSEPQNLKAGEITKGPEGFEYLTDPTKEEKGEKKEKLTANEKRYQQEVALADKEGRERPTRMEVEKEAKKTEAGEIKKKRTISAMKTEMLDGGKDEYDANSYDFNTTNDRNEVSYWDTTRWNESKITKIPKKVGLTSENIQELSDLHDIPVEDVLKAVGAISGNPPDGVKATLKEDVLRLKGDSKEKRYPIKKRVSVPADVKAGGWTSETIQELMKQKGLTEEQALANIRGE